MTKKTLGSTGPIHYDQHSRTMRWRTTKNMVLVKPACVTVYRKNPTRVGTFYGDRKNLADWDYASSVMNDPDVTGVQVQPAIYKEIDPKVGPAF